MLVNHTSDKDLISEKYKEVIKLKTFLNSTLKRSENLDIFQRRYLHGQKIYVL